MIGRGTGFVPNRSISNTAGSLQRRRRIAFTERMLLALTAVTEATKSGNSERACDVARCLRRAWWIASVARG